MACARSGVSCGGRASHSTLHGSRVIRDMGLRGAIRGKLLRTTISDRAALCALDHVNRQFHASAPDRLWLADFTYVATWAGFVYVAFVIDAYAGGSSAGGPAGRRTPTSSSTLSNKRSMTEGPPVGAASSITAIAEPNIFRSSTRSVSPKRGSNFGGSVGDSYDNASRDDQWPLQG